MAEHLDDIAGLDAARAVGVLVPPSNPVIEPELHRLLPTTLKLFCARLPVMPGTTLEQRNRSYVDLYADALASFGTLPLEAAVVGLTGPSYRLLPAGDQALTAALSSATRPVATASMAIARALGALGAERLCLFSPYPGWLEDEASLYWTAAGFKVNQIVRADEKLTAYELNSGHVMDALRAVRRDEVDVVVMSGTGMITLPTIVASRSEMTTPILSSNLCCAWWLMRQTGGHRPSPGFVAASRELAALLEDKADVA